MSSTDTRTVDPAQPHPSDNGGHEMSDFSWTTVLWLIPLSVITLLVFFYVCIEWFKGAKDNEISQKQSEFVPSELYLLHAKESEILSSYKWLDKEKGRVQIPINRAMELVAQEHQGKPGKEWKPITDLYLEGAAFTASSAPATAPAAEDNGINIESAPEERHGAKPASAHKPMAGKTAKPAQNAGESKGATHNAPGGAPAAK
jgi:hypothetical protein